MQKCLQRTCSVRLSARPHNFKNNLSERYLEEQLRARYIFVLNDQRPSGSGFDESLTSDYSTKSPTKTQSKKEDERSSTHGRPFPSAGDYQRVHPTIGLQEQVDILIATKMALEEDRRARDAEIRSTNGEHLTVFKEFEMDTRSSQGAIKRPQESEQDLRDYINCLKVENSTLKTK